MDFLFFCEDFLGNLWDILIFTQELGERFGWDKQTKEPPLGCFTDELESCQNRDNYRERGNFSPVIITTILTFLTSSLISTQASKFGSFVLDFPDISRLQYLFVI